MVCVDINTFNYDQLLKFSKTYLLSEVNVIKVFLKYYNVNENDTNEDTLLHIACQHQSMDLVQYLLEHNINVNGKNKDGGNTPLTYSSDRYFNVEILEILLKTKSIDINNVDKNQNSLLIMAIEMGNVTVINLIKKYCDNSKINKINNDQFIKITRYYPIEIVELILPYVNNINDVNELGTSALHLACECCL